MARPNQISGLDSQKVTELFLSENTTKQQAAEALARFIIKDVKDIALLASFAQKFSLSIDSKKIFLFLQEAILKINSVSELKEMAVALCKCGFYKEHLTSFQEIIYTKTLQALSSEFNKRKPNPNNAVSLLIHLKNLGIFDASSVEQKDALRKNLILLSSFDLSEVGYRSLIEFAVYCKEGLKIEIPQNLIELNKKRAAESQLDSTSKIHLKIFHRLIAYLSNGAGKKEGWKHKFERISEYHYRCGNLDIIAEAEYASLGEGLNAARKVDCLIILKRPNGQKQHLAIEVDGDMHFSLIDNELMVNGKTRARNNLLEQYFGRENLLIIPQDHFKNFSRQDDADEFFKNVRQISEIISMMESDLMLSPQAAAVAVTESEEEVKDSPKKPEPKNIVVEEEVEVKKIKPKKSDDEILAEFLEIRRREEEEIAKTPEGFLLKMVRQEHPDFEKIEEVLKEKSASLTSEFMRQLFKELKADNAELFLLLFVNCSEDKRTEIFSKKFLKTLPPLMQAIVMRTNAGVAKRVDGLVFSENSKWMPGSHENLLRLINAAQTDFCCYDTNVLAQCSSRFELEFIMLSGFYKQLSTKDKNRFVQYISLHNNLNLLKILLERELVKVEEINEDTVEILMRDAIDHQNLEMIEFLKAKDFKIKGISIKQKDNPPRSMICRAVSYGGLPIIRYLIEELGYDPNTEIEIRGLKWNILAIAVANGYSDVVKYLVGRGADYNYKDSQNLTLFDNALSRDYIEIADYLINLPNAKSFFINENAEQYQNLNQELRDLFTIIIKRNSYKSLEYLVNDFMPNKMKLSQDYINNFFDNTLFKPSQNIRVGGALVSIPNVFLDAIYEGSFEVLENLFDVFFSYNKPQQERNLEEEASARIGILKMIMIYNKGANIPISMGNLNMLKCTFALNEKYKLFPVDYNELLKIPFDEDVDPSQQKLVRDFLIKKALEEKQKNNPGQSPQRSEVTVVKGVSENENIYKK